MNTQMDQKLIQPIAKLQIQVESTPNSFAENVFMIEDYLQSETDSLFPQRSPNPIPFAQSHFSQLENESDVDSQTSSLVEGFFWLK